MINLLPTKIKKELRFAKLNTKLVRYLWFTGSITIVLGAIFASAIFYLRIADRQAEQDLITTKSNMATYVGFQAAALADSQRITAIKTITASQTRFSLLISDIAKVLPQGTSLSGIILTGDAAKPVQLSINTSTYDQTLAARNAIATSPRIAGVDLVTVTEGVGGYSAVVVVAFKPGAAR